MVIYARVDIDGKNYPNFKDGNVSNNIGEANAVSNFTLSYDNWQGLYSGCWNVGDNVLVTIGSVYPFGNVDSVWQFNGTTVNSSNNDIGSANLVFHTTFDKTMRDETVQERKTPYTQPYVWYPLDGDVYDYGPSGLDATLISGAYGQLGTKKCLVIGSGISEFVTVPNTALSGLNNFTIATNFKLDKMNVGGAIISMISGTSNDFLINFNSGTYPTIGMLIDNTGSPTSYIGSSATLLDLQWHHLAVSRSGTTATCYLDGTIIGTQTVSGTTLKGMVSGIVLGQEQDIYPYSGLDTTQCLFGRLSDFRIYDKAISQTEIQDIANRIRINPPTYTNEAVWFKADGNGYNDGYTGTKALLMSGAAYHATGKTGSCFLFAGSPTCAKADTVHLGQDLFPSGNSPVSMTAWVNPATINAGSVYKFVIIGSAAPNRHLMQYTAGSYAVGMGGGSQVYYVVSLSSGTWYHAGYTYNGSFAWSYWNGSLVGSGNIGNGPFINNMPIAIGEEWSAPGIQNWIGRIDDVRIYNYKLTGSDIAFIYNSGNGTNLTLGSYYLSGKIGYAGNFVKKSRVVYPPITATDFQRDDKDSIAFWMKTTSTSADTDIILTNSVLMTNATYGWHLLNTAKETNFPLFRYYRYGTSGAGITTEWQVNFNDGNWHHIVITYNGSSKASGVKLYVDGELQPVNNIILDTLTGSTYRGSLALGGMVGRTDNIEYDGLLDDVRIYNIELTAEQAIDLYNETSKTGYFYGK